MKKYLTLEDYYKDYITEPERFKEIVQNRLHNELAIKTNLYIHPFIAAKGRLSTKYEIFYLPVSQINKLTENIYENSNIIQTTMNELPPIAAQQLFFNTLIFELQSTNDIEGVRSSKQELGSAMTYAIRNSKKEHRFSGLVKQYLNIEEGNYNRITQVKDFRKIWDELVKQEEKDQLPDGKLFRTKPETIMSGMSKIIHEGDPTEKDIIADLTALIKTMSNDDIPPLEKSFICHYFYEYVHPFYDGNGRTGRFITCSYLARKLDPMTAISFSSTIAQQKNYYYKSFVEMTNPLNYGEATNLIIRMLTILEVGQKNFIKRLKIGQKLLNKANKIITDLHLEHGLQEILAIYFQKYIFGTYAPEITDDDLTHILNKSRYYIRQYTQKLEKLELISIQKEKPKVHTLSQDLRKQVVPLH